MEEEEEEEGWKRKIMRRMVSLVSQ